MGSAQPVRAASVSARKSFLPQQSGSCEKYCEHRYISMEKGTPLAGGGSVAGGLSSALCPACIPTIGSFFTAIGLGALVNLRVMGVLTAGLLLFGLTGLYLNFRVHRKWHFLAIGVLASIGVFGGRYLSEILPLVYGSGIVLITNALLDYRMLKKQKICKR